MNHYTDDMEKNSETVERPALGCRPYYVAIAQRIEDLADAIRWQAETQCNTDMINLWAHEIELQCEMLNVMLLKSTRKAQRMEQMEYGNL